MSPLYRAFPDASFIFSALTLRMTPFGKRDWDIDTLKSRPCWPQQCKGLILKKREEWEVEVSILGYTSSISLYLSVHICVFKYLTLYFVLSHFSRVRLFATPWTVARQVPLSMGFSRQEHWSRLPFPSPGNLPDPGIEPMSSASPALTEPVRFLTDILLNAHNIW